MFIYMYRYCSRSCDKSIYRCAHYTMSGKQHTSFKMLGLMQSRTDAVNSPESGNAQSRIQKGTPGHHLHHEHTQTEHSSSWRHTEVITYTACVCSLMTTNWRPGLAKHWLKTYVLLPLILTLEYNCCWVKIQHYWTKMKFYSK